MAVFFVFGTALFPTFGIAQETPDSSIRLTPATAAQIARQALARGELAVAKGISDALLQRLPDNYQLLMVRTLVADREGDLETARRLVRRAYRNAEGEVQTFEAAWLAANIAGRQDRWEASKIWLRRADQAAPNDELRDRVEAAFRSARLRSPWRIQLGFTVRPTDNLNNGSDPDDTIENGGFTGSTENRVGGLEAATTIGLTYRLRENQESRTDAFLQSFVRLSFPESGFEEIVPDASRREFDFVTLVTGVRHRQLFFDELGPTGFRIGYGGSYFRNSLLSTFIDLSASQDFRISSQQTLRFGVNFRDETRRDTDNASSNSRGLSMDWFGRMSNGLQVSAGLSFSDFTSNAATVEGRRYELRGSAALGRPILGATPDVNISLALRDLPEFQAFLAGGEGLGRQDITTRVGLGLNFNDRTWYGFAPRIELQSTTINSELDLFDRQSLSVGVTLVSRF